MSNAIRICSDSESQGPGEIRAVKALSDSAAGKITPLFEVTPVPLQYKKNEPPSPRTTGEDYVKQTIKKLYQARGSLECFIQAPWELHSRRSAIAIALEQARAAGMSAIPVVALSDAEDARSAIRDAARTDGRGVCFRVAVQDFEDPTAASASVGELLNELSLGHESVDLLVDMRDVVFSPLARTILDDVKKLGSWRSTTLAATSMPKTVSDKTKGSTYTVDRKEWTSWNVVRRGAKLGFGDYAINHPDLVIHDPRLVSPAAKIRYTTNDGYLIVQGRVLRKVGYEQFNDLARKIVGSATYSGKGYSWGDEYLRGCAAGEHTGNLTTWVQVGTNHHLTLVGAQVATALGV